MKIEYGAQMKSETLWAKVGNKWNQIVTSDDMDYIRSQETRYKKAMIQVKLLPYGVKP